MILVIFIFGLLASSDASVIRDEDADPVIVVRFQKSHSIQNARKELGMILGLQSEDILILRHDTGGKTFGFKVEPGASQMTLEELVTLLAASEVLTVVLPGSIPAQEQLEFPEDKQFWEKPWFVVVAAITSGLVVFFVMAPPIYWCMKRSRGGELQRIDSNTAKRYDTIGRDGSIQSRRKLAPTTLTLSDITQPSTDSSDSDSSPPGIKEALQSRTNPLTPLQLRQRLDNPALLYSEFSSMPTNEERRAVKRSSLKNRYKGVLPNIHTRVRLKGKRSSEDYINANYTKGYKGMPRVYIATQGPLKNTVDDFWTLIWQEKVNTIVMITKLQEKGRNKCVIYWPETVGTYGDYTVTVRDSTQYEGFTVTSMLLTDGEEVHRVCHLWMWSWPDQGVPDSSRSLLALLSCVHSIWQVGSCPLVVHCSAGLGRTGCFIAVDIGLQSLQHDRVVDVNKIVAGMRLDRGGMVQTLEQYEFVHRALLRHEVSQRNKHRFKGLRQASFSHEGPPEALYREGLGRRMSHYSTSHISHALDIASTSLPTYMSPLLGADHPEVPSPDSPVPPSLLQLSQLMEKSSKRKLKRTSAVDFTIDVNITDKAKGSPPRHPIAGLHAASAADDSSPEFLKAPTPLAKSSFSLDLGRSGETSKRELPRSASEDTPEYLDSSPSAPYSSKSINSMQHYFTFDFEAVEESTEGVDGNGRGALHDSPTAINP